MSRAAQPYPHPKSYLACLLAARMDPDPWPGMSRQPWPNRGRALAVASGVLAGISPLLSRRCGALGAAVEGDSPYLRQLLLKWALPLERVQEHCNLLLSIINQLGSQW